MAVSDEQGRRTPSGSDPAHQMDAVERMVHRVLLAGVTISVALMLAGFALGLVTGSGFPHGVAPLRGMASGLAKPDPLAYLTLGVLVLVATPFVRVAGSLVAFAREHDVRYVLITLVVLIVMCLGVLVGEA